MKNFKGKVLESTEGLNALIGTTKELSWTMIYDEGFEVTIGDLLIFNFNHYEKPPGKF